MTNLEKFQEVFGITIDDRYVRPFCQQCRMLDTLGEMKTCEDYATCHECPLFKFWDKEYVEKA